MTDAIRSARRRFLRNLAIGGAAAASSVPLQASAHDWQRSFGHHLPSPGKISFVHGVASGDPLHNRVVIWTRVTLTKPLRFGHGLLPLAWEVSLDKRFQRVIRRGITLTGPDRDYTAKVDVSHLPPNRVLYYRFSLGRNESPVGRTRTLPLGNVEQVKLAVFSCSNFPAGYFHAYAEAAKLTDVHAAIHLGDYIYEYPEDGYASEDAAALGRESDPVGELLTLSDYRLRYAQYRSDPDLQALHAAMPMIAVWDDHEIANNTWKEGAENHDPATEGDFFARRDAALQAWHEWLPVRTPDMEQPERIYRSFAFGDLLSLHMLDTRVIARDRQLEYGNYFGASGFDAARFASDMADPSRQMLGTEQSAWLQGQMARSSATWQVLGQQVLMGRMNIPAPVVLQTISFSAYSALLVKAQTAPQTLTPQDLAILSQPAIPYNLDAWDGYTVAREVLLGTARALNKNLVVLSGDTHNAWASDLADMQGNAVGVEFATAGVSSPGLEAYFPAENPVAVAAGLTQLIGPLKYAETANRGFMLVTATATECRAEWQFVSTVKSQAYTSFAGKTLRTKAGERKLEIV